MDGRRGMTQMELEEALRVGTVDLSTVVLVPEDLEDTLPLEDAAIDETPLDEVLLEVGIVPADVEFTDPDR